MKRYFTESPDKLIAITAAIIGLVVLTLTLLGAKSFIIQASMIAFSSILYLALGQRKKKEEGQKANFSIMALVPVFLGVSGTGVLAYLYSPSDIMLDVSILALGGVILLVQIRLMSSACFWYKSLILAETFLLAVLLRLLPPLNNSGFPGSDPWVLFTTSREILKTGFVSPCLVYGDFPIYNILISVGSIITSFDVRASTFLMVGFAEAFSIFFVYLIAKVVWDYQTGLIASLFYALTPSSIDWGAYPVPMSIGITLAIFLTGLLLQSTKTVSALPYRSLACLLVITIVLTHTITSTIVILILVVMSLNAYLLKIRYKLQSTILFKDIPKFNVIVILSFLSTLAYWVCVATSFFSGATITVALILGVYYPKEFAIQSYVVPINPVKMFFDDLGLITLYSLAVVGSFLALSKRETKNAFIVLTITVALYWVSVLLPFLGIVSRSTILADRWEPFLFAFLVCLSSRALQFFRRCFSIRTSVAVFAVIGMLMIPSVVAYAPENWDRYSRPVFFLSSELAAAGWAKGHLSSQDIVSDVRYSVFFGEESKEFGQEIISGDITQVVKSLPNKSLLVSKYSFLGGKIVVSTERKTFGYVGVTLRLPYDINSFLDNPYYNRFFSNGGVTSYG